jgi:hypothetical protein
VRLQGQVAGCRGQVPAEQRILMPAFYQQFLSLAEEHVPTPALFGN